MNAQQVTKYLLVSALLGAAAPFARADIKLGQERFSGRGTRGPYAISRQAVEDRSEQVWVNGRHMTKGQDYLFDAGMGALSFIEPIRFSDSVQVDYQYDTNKAHAPTGIGGTMGLLNGGSGGLAITYAFKPNGTDSQTLSGLGFSGQANVAGNTLTSSFMVDKSAGATAGADAQNTLLNMSRTTGRLKFDLGYARVGQKFGQADAMKLIKGSEALNFNGTLQLAPNSAFTLQQVRNSTTDAKTGVVKVTSLLNFDGSLQLAPNSALTLKQVQNSTPDAKTGIVKNTSLLSGGLGLSLSANTRFTALHETQSEAQGKNGASSAVDRLQLDQKLGKNATASLLNETVTTSKNGQDETVKATKMNVAASGDHGLKMETALSMTDSSKSGAARDAAMNLSGGDGNTKISLAVTDRRADSGDVQTHALTLESVQSRGLRFSGGVAGEKTAAGTHEKASLGMSGGTSDRLRFALAMSNDSGAGKQGVGTNLSMSSALANGLKFSASRMDDKTVANGGASATKMNLDATTGDVKVVMAYDGNDNGTLNKTTSGLNIVATPNDTLKLTATAGQKTDEKGSVETKAVGVQANPNGNLSLAVSHNDSTDATGLTGINNVSLAAGGSAMKLTGSYADKLSPTGASSVTKATLNLVPVKDRLVVAGSYSDEMKQDNTQIQIAMLQADIKPSSALAVSGFYKQRDTGTADQINTMNASVTLHPTGAVQMVGTYSSNPEEKDNVLRLVRKGLALQTKVGGLTFSGGYTQENSLVDPSEGTRAEFKLALKCGKDANLEGGFAQTIGAVRGYAPQLAYNMKYTHNIGADFNLLLDANVVNNDASVPLAQRKDVKATANLGLRF